MTRPGSGSCTTRRRRRRSSTVSATSAGPTGGARARTPFELLAKGVEPPVAARVQDLAEWEVRDQAVERGLEEAEHARGWQRGASLASVPLCLLSAVLMLNLWVGYFPTVQSAWG